jgi:hypothetical protein
MNTLFGECHAPLNARQMATALLVLSIFCLFDVVIDGRLQ